MNNQFCQNYMNCVNLEKKKLRYPSDINSLFFNQIYDDQIARQRCYNKYPGGIVEGFNNNLSWDQIIKGLVIVLLVILFLILAKDFLITKRQVIIKDGIQSPSEMNLTTIKGFDI